MPDTLNVELPDGRSLVLLGENGTGKSTIADALEWFFTGHLEFLRHEGRQHAVRHLGATPETETKVEIQTDGVLGGSVVGTERAASASVAGAQETFLLRGRTLAAFVDKSKAEKRRALAELLGLDEVHALRLDLQRARNDLGREAAASEQNRDLHRASLRKSVSELDETAVLDEIRRLAVDAKVRPPESLKEVADPSWVDDLTREDEAVRRSAALVNLRSSANSLDPPSVAADVLHRWNRLVGDGHASGRLERRVFQDAADLLEQAPDLESCPLCGQAVDQAELRSRVVAYLDQQKALSDEIEVVGSEVELAANALRDWSHSASVLREAASQLGVDSPSPPSAPHLDLLRRRANESPIERQVVAEFLATCDTWVTEIRSSLGATAVEASERSSLVRLVALATEVRGWLPAEAEARRRRRAADIAAALLEAYERKEQETFTAVLDQISTRVAHLYGRLHPDEGLDAVAIEPWTNKGVELSVGFHGSTQRPPHGVLSESHLNSLAVALFLAMAETFNEHLGFLVLDDVVNSFDIEHRGSLAELLAAEFKDWQLIVLTHDPLFFARLRRLGPNWRALEFTSWTYEFGPRVRSSSPHGLVDQAIEGLDDRDDRQGACTKVRRHLEEVLQECCEHLEAPVPFKRGVSNDQRDATEFIKGLRRCLKVHDKLLGKAIENLLGELEADLQAALNIETHANPGHASQAEVRAAIARVLRFDDLWTCQECGHRIWERGSAEASRCKCGEGRFPTTEAQRAPLESPASPEPYGRSST